MQKLDDIILSLYMGLPVGTCKIKSSAYEHSFFGSDGVTWLVEHSFCPAGAEADTTMALLMARGALVGLVSDQFSAKLVYRLQVAKKEPVGLMNAAKNFKAKSRPALELVFDLLEDILERRQSGGAVLLDKKQAAIVSLKATELQGADITPLSCAQRRVFYVNLYNYMMCFIVARFGMPANDFALQDYHERLVFIVGGNTYTPNDIKYASLLLVSPYPPADERLALAVTSVNPMDLFALSDGSEYTAPVHVYYEETFDYTLQSILRQFFQEQIKVDASVPSVRPPPPPPLAPQCC